MNKESIADKIPRAAEPVPQQRHPPWWDRRVKARGLLAGRRVVSAPQRAPESPNGLALSATGGSVAGIVISRVTIRPASAGMAAENWAAAIEGPAAER